VDLYPFEKTVASGGTPQEIIEKIDIGGISLIRAAAKNFQDVLCVADRTDYPAVLEVLKKNNGGTTLAERQFFAAKAFNTSSHYDSAIFNYFNQSAGVDALKLSVQQSMPLRYGENPHQQGRFYGDFEALFTQLHGKELSYNNLLDIDAAVQLIQEFKNDGPTFAILKHNNACGLATRDTLKQAYLDALAADPTSAFGGVLIANKTLDIATAQEIDQLFCEVVIAPGMDAAAVEVLQSKKNRILLIQKETETDQKQVRTALNGYLVQDKDNLTETEDQLTTVTTTSPTPEEVADLLFAAKLCKHTKSNTIVLAKKRQLIASGPGQTSRVDAVQQAMHKANTFGFDLKGAAMASDAFFPFPDCVEIADQAGITAVIQPGGSIKDSLSIDYCNEHNMSMVLTGIRHFKH
jgi:phosphoribosylaminoimidazolecarboxamide formyltransferase/IMP cyclohydrolase